MIRRLAIIPARAGSKRIHNKNLKIFHGKPLIYYSITAAKKSNLFNKIHVSSDSKKILNFSKKLDIKIDFIRPKYLADDKTPLREVLQYVVSTYKKKKMNFDEIWLIYATNPFITSKKLKNCAKAYKKISNKNNNALVTVTKYNYPIEWAQKISSKNILKPLNYKNIKKSSHKIKKLFCDAGMINIYSSKSFTKNVNISYFPFEIPIYSSVDIDTVNDFEFAKRLFSDEHI